MLMFLARAPCMWYEMGNTGVGGDGGREVYSQHCSVEMGLELPTGGACPVSGGMWGPRKS